MATAQEPNPYFLEAMERLTSAVEAGSNNGDGEEERGGEDEQEQGRSSARSEDSGPETHAVTRTRTSRTSIDERELTNPHASAWKEFDQDSEAGRMLRKLYAGRRHNAPLASYPKFRSKSRDLRPDSWFTGKPGVDPRQRTERREREQKVNAPRPTRADVKPAPAILSVPKRKPQERIEIEQRRISEERAVERPLPRKAVSTDTEKRRLAMQFQFKGGKALPESGTIAPIQGNVPLSLISGKPSKALLRRSQREKAQAQIDAREQQRRKLEQDFDQVHEEIQELKSQMANIEDSSASARLIAHFRSELRQRHAELETIDSLLREDAKAAEQKAASA